MSERRFSAWQVIGLVVAIMGFGAVMLGAGGVLGYQVGRMDRRVQVQVGPGQAFPWPLPEGKSRIEASNFPYLGVKFEMITPELAQAETLAADTGAILRAVMPESPAEKAGLKVGDIIQQVDGEPVDPSNTLRDRIANHTVGDEVALTIVREKETLNVKVTLAASSDLPSFFPPDDLRPARPGFKFDFRCESGPCPFFPEPHRVPQRQPRY